MASDEALKDEKRARFHAYLNGKYHSDREAYYDLWDKVTTFGILATGAVAFFEVFGEHAQRLGAAVLTLFALAQLVFSLSAKARDHLQLKRSYFDIASRVENGEITPKTAFAKMTRLSGDESPPYMALHAIAENWAYQAVYGQSKTDRCEIGWFRRLTRHLLRHSEHDFSC